MSYRWVNQTSTVCDDTPQNRSEFEAFAATIASRPGLSNKTARSLSPEALEKERFNRQLNAQISKENKRIRQSSTFLPGYQPSHF